MIEYIKSWGILGGLLKLLFGNMLIDSDNSTLSTNRVFAFITGVYGLIIQDYTLVGIGVGQAIIKTGIEAYQNGKEPSSV